MPLNSHDAVPATPNIPGRIGPVLFVLATVLSAALLFMVEPMIARMLLPHFGGSASVWSVALVFFQAALLLGYLYAHALAQWLPLRLGVAIHLCVLASGLAVLPVAVHAATMATASVPLNVLLTLAASVGLPFAALSANAPLLQAWYAASRLPGAHNPYPLYAASNAGSFASLLAFPFIVEPLFAMRAQSAAWSVGYLLLIALIAAAAWSGKPRRQAHPSAPPAPQATARTVLSWLALAMLPSAGLVAVTAHISSDVAAAPFLWVLPLALYLLTFIIAFGGRGEVWVARARAALPLFLLAVAAGQGAGLRLGFFADLALHLSTFFLLALAAHGLLAARRPPIEALTQFYLAMSAGGLIGGVAAALLAPALFSFVAEYPLVLVCAALLTRWPLPVALVTAAAMAAPLLLQQWAAPGAYSARYRSFYGVHTVQTTPDGRYRILRHGQEIHGAQQIADSAGKPLVGKPQPLTYYHEQGPISEAIDAVRVVAGGGAIDIAVVGLGAGSIACLAEKTDRVDFFEIDPAVIALAQDRRNFTFLPDCGPATRIVEGDARMTLAHETRTYDILIVDAFSSDAIPTHLLTREALAIYLARLKPNGMLALHISNDHIRLNEIVAATARSLGLHVVIYDEDAPANLPVLAYQATVVVMARSEAALGPLAASDEWPKPPEDTGVAPWSDDYSNLLGAILARLRER